MQPKTMRYVIFNFFYIFSLLMSFSFIFGLLQRNTNQNLGAHELKDMLNFFSSFTNL